MKGIPKIRKKNGALDEKALYSQKIANPPHIKPKGIK